MPRSGISVSSPETSLNGRALPERAAPGEYQKRLLFALPPSLPGMTPLPSFLLFSFPLFFIFLPFRRRSMTIISVNRDRSAVA